MRRPRRAGISPDAASAAAVRPSGTRCAAPRALREAARLSPGIEPLS